ncbi:MAG: polysaccharide deacetylase family protein [Chitinophagaceae bacterium]|nr:polysaccharide deacetylase family protein [Chitinophagaceae bacterium]
MRFFLIIFFAAQTLSAQDITRGDTSIRKISIVFTGDSFADGGNFIRQTLNRKNVKGSFFLTGNFYRNKNLHRLVESLKKDGHYLGSHSDKHLLYCDWEKRDSLLVTREEFFNDLENSYKELNKFSVTKNNARYFLPPFEWYNDSITKWTCEAGLQLINFTPGSRSTADYTYPEMGNRYVASDVIFKSITDFEEKSPSGMNGFILLVHIGTDPRRTDKFYKHLPRLIDLLRKKGYTFVRVDELLTTNCLSSF